MNFFGIAGIIIVTAAISLVLRRQNPEFAMMTAIAGGLVVILLVASEAQQVFKTAEQTMNKMKIPMNGIIILIKALGISYVSQFASDVCKDSGENAFASNIEIAGKVAIVAVSLPLLGTFIDIIQKILG